MKKMLRLILSLLICLVLPLQGMAASAHVSTACQTPHIVMMATVNMSSGPCSSCAAKPTEVKTALCTASTSCSQSPSLQALPILTPGSQGGRMIYTAAEPSLRLKNLPSTLEHPPKPV